MRTILSASSRRLAAASPSVGGQDRLRHSRQFAEMFSGRVARQQIHIRVHHDSHEFVKSHFWFPTENFLRLRSVTKQNVHLGWPLISRVVLYELFPIKIDATEGGLDKLAHGVAFASSQDEVISFSKLQNSPDALHILRRISPVTFCIQVAEKQFLL